MPELLIRGSRGEEVRRLQTNLNAALAGQRLIVDGQNVLPLTADGKFGRFTEAAVFKFQRDYKLKKKDGKVGHETRDALAMRAIVIVGTVTRNPNPPAPVPPPSPPVVPPLVLPPLPSPVVPPASRFLVQLQPALGLTPPPFASNAGPGSSVVSGQVAFGLVYRTATEGPHWEFGGAFQPSINSVNSPTDPRYTLQLQGNVTYADPYHHGRFHTALFGQASLLANFAPGSLGAGLLVGGQLSVDIIDDRWNLFSQAGVAGLWTMAGSGAGQLSFGPAFTILGTTIQWGL